ncbi:MAG: ZIP family metal transporter [Candidatus Paceibacterota bacterium]|jgi:ZIP family zinc transporter
MTLALISIAVFAATLVGGVFALKFRDRLHLILGFSAGAVAGVALFDLLPEAFELGAKYHDVATVSLFIALGFFGYLILDRLILLHTHDEDSTGHEASHRGSFGALTLASHSFLDGVAVGVAFQASTTIGIVVAVAVLAHDFSDGINTVSFIVRSGRSRMQALKWLLVDAAAPVVGIVSTLFFIIPEASLSLILAIFVGTFIYLSSSDLIPESHHQHPRALTTGMTLLGALVIYVVVNLV